MEPIYKTDSMPLSCILENLGSGGEATFLIPDLQRDFVWNPPKIVALLDTLIKGWPFGHIVLANAGPHAKAFSPRQFYKKVFIQKKYNISDNRNEEMSRDADSDKFTLILDGQQRLQSILLALGNVDGIEMTEYDWLVLNGNKRNRKPRYICSPALLGVHLKNLALHYEEIAVIEQLNYLHDASDPIFSWVLRDKAPNHWNWHWKNELPRTFEELRGKVIPLNKLWKECASGIPEEGALTNKFHINDSEVLPALKAFCSRLFQMHQLEVPYVEILATDPSAASGDGKHYNDMILNIFTRLNAGGVELSREDITLSWIKRNWEKSEEGNTNRDAKTCITTLLKSLSVHYSITITSDEFVNQLSIIWGIVNNKGVNITNKDLMGGALLRDAALWISHNWNLIETSMMDVFGMLHKRDLKYAVHYFSLRAVSLLVSWCVIGKTWFKNHGDGAHKDSIAGFNNVFINKLGERIDRFVFAGQWAESWNHQHHYTSLYNDQTTLAEIKNIGEAEKFLLNQIDVIIKTMKDQAEEVIDNLNAKKRNEVSRYKNFLWIWHRLKRERAEYSNILARHVSGSQEGNPHVDHCIAHNYWANTFLPTHGVEVGSADFYQKLEKINQLGNCNIIVGAINISMSDKSGEAMENFLKTIIGEDKITPCLVALDLDRLLIYPQEAKSTEEILNLLEARTLRIKTELKSFLNDPSIVRHVDQNVSTW